MSAAKISLMPRGGGRAEPVTQWRRDLAQLADQMTLMIVEHEDPEHRFKTATEIAQDFVWNVKCDLRREFGKVFDPVIDGYEKPPRPSF